MSQELITTQRGLAQLCEQIEAAKSVCFDTEFVSEHTYRPELCLLQVAIGAEMALVDPLAVGDMTPFWQTLVTGERQTIVHAGRQELMFCLQATDRAPVGLFDVQLAAGMVGFEYPAGYGNLVFKLLNHRAHKGETRTDWRRRPLSDRQLEYALEDVRHLESVRNALAAKLEALDRWEWFRDEQAAWLADVDDLRLGERWRRVSGSAGLSRRGLAIVRELWTWREHEAERRNRPVRLVLRDDLIVELAKRASADEKQIAALRGMERGDLKRAAPELSRVIDKALHLPDEALPREIRTESNSHLTMLGQFLSSALGSICRDAEIAASLVGTPNDVRDLIAYRIERGNSRGELPLLARGWRAEIVGQVLDDVLAGKVAVRIRDPRSEQPLVFERRPDT